MAATPTSVDSEFYLQADQFFAEHRRVGMTYDDVTLATLYSEDLPKDTQLSTTLAEARKGGAVLAYGSFVTVALNFLILAFIIFLMVKQINRLKREEPAPPPAAAAEDIVLLREIRDSLKR